MLKRAIVVTAALLGLGAAHAQESFPSGNVTIVVPYAAGGAADTFSRYLAERLTAKWGHNVLVENKPGGGTIIGLDSVAKAEPDGHTIGYFAPSFTVNAALRSNLPYDTVNDFRALYMLSLSPMVLTVNPSVQVSTLEELKAHTDSNAENPPGFATSGIGGIPHMATELLMRESGIRMTHIPYAGSAGAITDVVAGHVPVSMDVWASVKELIADGQLKPIAVSTAERFDDLPDVPAIAESFPGFDEYSYSALLLPAGVPDEVVDILYSDIDEIVQSEEFQAYNAKAGALAAPQRSPDELQQFVEAEIEKWREIGAAAGITLE